ncbi:hypothetical protein A4S05_03000 [Nostoc sp. KVJ20]|nr:hypothetical protein A4S05_03000 [Nostoc sp. KVJ20]
MGSIYATFLGNDLQQSISNISFEDFYIKNQLVTNFSFISSYEDKNNYNQLNLKPLRVPASSYPTIVNITATKMYASQFGEIGEFVITRTGNITQDLIVKYRIHGTAEDGVHYQSIANFVTITAGASEIPIIIQPQKSDYQGLKTVLLTLENLPKSSQYMLGTNFHAVVNILNL